MKLDDLTLDVEQHIEIKAAPEKVFPALLHDLGRDPGPTESPWAGS